MGKKWVDIFILLYRCEYIENFFKRIVEEKILNNYENEIVIKNGDIKWILWNNIFIESLYLNEFMIILIGFDIM